MNTPGDFLPTTPPEAVEETVRERVILGETTFLIDRPARSEDLIDHPAIRSAFLRDEYLPYWADLWPAARMLARAAMIEPVTQDGTALEIGCGLGLPGIAALSVGWKVIFSDYDPTAVSFAASNARINGFRNFEEMPFDWRRPPGGLKVDIVLASDLTYEARNIEPIVALLQEVLRPGGICLWTDQDRPPAALLRQELDRLSWPYSTKPMRAGRPGGERFKGTLYRIERPG